MFKCPFCGVKTANINALRIHIRRYHECQKISCPYCGVHYNKISALMMHCREKLKENQDDLPHLALYVLLHRNKDHGYTVKLPKQILLMKQLKEVFRE